MKVLAVLAALAVAPGCTSAGGPTEREGSGPPESSGAGLLVVGDDSCRQFKNEAVLAIADGGSTALADLAPFLRAFGKRYPACRDDREFVSSYLDVLRWSGEAETYNRVLGEWDGNGRLPLDDHHQPMPAPSGAGKS